MNIFVFGLRGFPNIQGGVEIHSSYLYPSLIQEGFNFTVFRRIPFVNQKSKNSSFPNIKFVDLPSTKVKGLEAFFHSCLCTVSTIVKRPDVVHIHNIGPGFFIPFLKLFRIRVILTYHSPNYEHQKWRMQGKIFLRLCEMFSLRFADRIIFVNEQQMNKFPRVKYKSIFIPNGVSNPSLSIKNESFYLEKYGLQERNYILYVGRITHEKGVRVLIKAYKKLKTGQKLVIAGAADNKSSYVREIYELAKNLPKIIFTGFISGDDLACLYKNARIFVLPSYNEGNPIVLLEAMSYGLDILASDIEANKTINLPDSFYFSKGNSDDLAKRIKDKLQSDPSTFRYDISQYSWENVVLQTKEVYKCLL